jgi:Zn-dependent protease
MAGSAAAGGTIAVNYLLGLIPLPAVFLPWGGLATAIVGTLVGINIFWGLINLLPVYPLDGGNVTRYALLQADPWNGIRTSLWISVIAGSLVAFAGLFFLRSLFLAFLFGFLAYQSYQSLQGRSFM